VIGTIQATEALKLVLGVGDPLVGRFLVYDALRMRFREIALRRDPDCPVCGDAPRITGLQRYGDHCAGPASGCGEDEMTVQELKARLDAGAAPLVLDVREPFEFDICRLPGATLVPLRELPGRVDELPRDREIVVVCKAGVRSALAAGFLRLRGFRGVHNLTGGMLRWIAEIDPSLPRY
jgi:adenylyltransferase/sulfurtransferase